MRYLDLPPIQKKKNVHFFMRKKLIMKKSSQNVKIFQWKSRWISTNLLAFENHIK